MNDDSTKDTELQNSADFDFNKTRPTNENPVISEETYVSSDDRYRQNLWHANHVPAYSALASTPPSRLVLTGVWLLFGPMALMGLVTTIASVVNPDPGSSILLTILSAGFSLIAAAILFKQTKRYLLSKRTTDGNQS